jgi:phosphohistidine swiveling domain-containing protein
MIQDLFKADGLTSFEGQHARDLAELVAAGLVVVPTVVLPIEAFEEWQDSGRVSDSDVDQLLRWAAENATEETLGLIIRASLAREYYGLLTNVLVKPNFTEIRSGIDRIYRSWGDEGARASRIVRNINEAEGKPSLIVQGLAKNIHSVLTRHAINGTLTNCTDYGENVNNRVPRFSREIDQLIRTCDAQLRRPVRIDFSSDDDCNYPAVISVSDEEMTIQGRCRALSDLLDNAIIDEVRFLMAISPDMIGFVRGWELVPASTSQYVRGLPASTGSAMGQLVFRGVRLPGRSSHGFVFLVEEFCPEDMELLEKCDAAIGLQGGMTSHLAVVCRGMGKPAVTGCGGKVNLRRRQYEMTSGQSVAEFTTALVDGQTGGAGFSEDGVKPHWIRSDAAVELSSRILMCCDRLPYSKFKKLTVKTQIHIAELKNRMREMDLLND